MSAWRKQELQLEHDQFVQEIKERFLGNDPSHEILTAENEETEYVASRVFGDLTDTSSVESSAADVALAFASRYGEGMSEAMKRELRSLQPSAEDIKDYKARYDAGGEILTEAPIANPNVSGFARTPMSRQLKYLGLVLGLILGFWLFCLIIG